jgi:hypothetical protein
MSLYCNIYDSCKQFNFYLLINNEQYIYYFRQVQFICTFAT